VNSAASVGVSTVERRSRGELVAVDIRSVSRIPVPEAIIALASGASREASTKRLLGKLPKLARLGW
jgi:hypothetical protein